MFIPSKSGRLNPLIHVWSTPVPWISGLPEHGVSFLQCNPVLEPKTVGFPVSEMKTYQFRTTLEGTCDMWRSCVWGILISNMSQWIGLRESQGKSAKNLASIPKKPGRPVDFPLNQYWEWGGCPETTSLQLGRNKQCVPCVCLWHPFC
jgi:hypothetical protein